MLKILMLRKRREQLEKKLKELREKESLLQTRQEEVAGAVEEAETDEELEVVESEIDDIEAQKEALEAEKSELEGKIEEIDAEIKELEEKSNEASGADDEARNKPIFGGDTIMERQKFFGGMTRTEAQTLVSREDVKEFLTRVRGFKGQSRAVTGADLFIPETLVGILRDEIHNYSKLVSKVWLRPLTGTARAILPGDIPEAVWMEACGKLNELEINFNEMEVDGYKVGGFIPVCNATLEDATDVSLYNEIMYMLAQAIGLAIDKAIIYGTGTKMPLGIVTRLAQTIKPDGYNPKARAWVNLSATNILKVTGATGEALYADLITKTGAIKNGIGEKVWVMNETTKTTLMAKLVTFNASGAIVASIDNTMPIIGGEIIILPFIPDGDVIGGYFGKYLLVERAGVSLAQSEHVRFIEDNTVFRGTARYDGAPTTAESFVAMNINNEAVTTTASFAVDAANPGV